MATTNDNKPNLEELKPIEVKLPPPPPDHIYKYRRNRATPSKDIWESGPASYIPERLEFVEGEGNFVYWVGVKLPSKTIAPAEAIYAVNPIKRRLLNLIRILSSRDLILPLLGIFLIGSKKRQALLNQFLDFFIQEADMTAMPYYLQDGYYCKVVREMDNFVETFLVCIGAEKDKAKRTAEIIGMLFEYDNAYRYRMQDILHEANKKALLENLPKEVQRLVVIHAQREKNTENNDVRPKFQSGAKLLNYAWKIPSLRKALRSSINAMNFDNVKLDEADIYHTLLYADYDTQGKTLNQRLGIYRQIEGEDLNKWPPRVIVRNTA